MQGRRISIDLLVAFHLGTIEVITYGTDLEKAPNLKCQNTNKIKKTSSKRNTCFFYFWEWVNAQGKCFKMIAVTSRCFCTSGGFVKLQ